jgi:hypothetical protein
LKKNKKTMPDNKQIIHKKIKSVLSEFAASNQQIRISANGTELYAKKKITIGKNEFNGMYFASVKMNKNFTVFYFFPIYSDPKLNAEIPDNLKKCLKGKTCFHIKKDDDEIYKSMKVMMNWGLKAYKKMGWA